MDRRTLLALAASFTAVSGTSAEACSPVLLSPRSTGLANSQVLELFRAWWDRDADKFRAFFSSMLMNDGTAMEPKLASELAADDPIPTETIAIFDRFFTDERKWKSIPIIVNTAAGVFVACLEAGPTQNIEGDCTGMPKLHLFLVRMRGLNVRSVAHLDSSETPEGAKVSIWTEG